MQALSLSPSHRSPGRRCDRGGVSSYFSSVLYAVPGTLSLKWANRTHRVVSENGTARSAMRRDKLPSRVSSSPRLQHIPRIQNVAIEKFHAYNTYKRTSCWPPSRVHPPAPLRDCYTDRSDDTPDTQNAVRAIRCAYRVPHMKYTAHRAHTCARTPKNMYVPCRPPSPVRPPLPAL